VRKPTSASPDQKHQTAPPAGRAKKSTAASPAATATPVPALTSAAATVQGAPAGGGIVNFIVRGRLEEDGARGVLYVSERREADVNLYFAARGGCDSRGRRPRAPLNHKTRRGGRARRLACSRGWP
jgi:hypothetical protein